MQALKHNQNLGDIQGAITYGPMPIETYIPDMFWYGIHSVESLYTLLGPGCETVARVHTDGADVVTGKWKDGRIGVVRGDRKDRTYGAVVFGSKSVATSTAAGEESKSTTPGQPARSGYYGVVSAVVKFFQTADEATNRYHYVPDDRGTLARPARTRTATRQDPSSEAT